MLSVQHQQHGDDAVRSQYGCCSCTDCGGFDNIAKCFWDSNARCGTETSDSDQADAYLSADYFSAREQLSDGDDACTALRTGTSSSSPSNPGNGVPASSASDRLRQGLRSLMKQKKNNVKSPVVTDGEEQRRADRIAEELISEETLRKQREQLKDSKKKFRKRRTSSSSKDPAVVEAADPEHELKQLKQRCEQLEARCSELGNQKAHAQEEAKKISSLLNKRQQHKRGEIQKLEKEIEQLQQLMNRRDETIKDLRSQISDKQALIDAANRTDEEHIKEYQSQLKDAEKKNELREREHLHVRTSLEEQIRHISAVNIQLDQAFRASEAQRMFLYQHLSASQQHLVTQTVHIRTLQTRTNHLERTLSTNSLQKSDDGSTTSSLPPKFIQTTLAIQEQIARTAISMKAAPFPKSVALSSTWDGFGSPTEFYFRKSALLLIPLLISITQQVLENASLVLIGDAAWSFFLQTPITSRDLSFGILPGDGNQELNIYDLLISVIEQVMQNESVKYILAVTHAVMKVEKEFAKASNSNDASFKQLKTLVRQCEDNTEDSTDQTDMLELRPFSNGWRLELASRHSLFSLHKLPSTEIVKLKGTAHKASLSQILPEQIVLPSLKNDPQILISCVSGLQRRLDAQLQAVSPNAIDALHLLRYLTLQASLTGLGYCNEITSPDANLGWDTLLARFDTMWLSLMIQTRRLLEHIKTIDTDEGGSKTPVPRESNVVESTC